MDAQTIEALLLFSSESSSLEEDDISCSDSFDEDDILYSDSFDEDEFDETEEDLNVNNFWDDVRNFSDEDFRRHFKLNRTTILFLIGMYAESDVLPNHDREQIGVDKEIYMTLWYLGNNLTFSQLGNLFDVARDSAWYVINRVIGWLIRISVKFIVWPRESVINTISSGFESINGMKNVIGAVDCSMIQIKAPETMKEDYFNRKRFYSISLQAVVDHESKFTDVYCGDVGSMPDARVLRRSKIYWGGEEKKDDCFPNSTFLVGDFAYPSLSWLVTTFEDTGNLTDSQKNFNYIHSLARNKVEKAFGLLKGRFQRLLHFTENTNLGFVVNTVVACCVLHNICILQKDEANVGIIEESDEENFLDNEYIPPGNDRRQQLLEELINSHLI